LGWEMKSGAPWRWILSLTKLWLILFCDANILRLRHLAWTRALRWCPAPHHEPLWPMKIRTKPILVSRSRN